VEPSALRGRPRTGGRDRGRATDKGSAQRPVSGLTFGAELSRQVQVQLAEHHRLRRAQRGVVQAAVEQLQVAPRPVPLVKGWGRIVWPRPPPAPGTARADHGTSGQERGLKHRADNETRTIPIPPELVRLLGARIKKYGTNPDGRVLQATRAGSSRPRPAAPCGPRPARARSPRRSAGRRSAAAPGAKDHTERLVVRWPPTSLAWAAGGARH
jgi:hypothetical protein